MSRPLPPPSTPAGPVLCLGETLVDLISEPPSASVAADPGEGVYRAHFGGAVANVAVTAARLGARVALAGGAGEDRWGRWLSDRLEREGVERTYFELRPGARTPLALISLDGDGEPSYSIYGEDIGTVLHAVGDRLEPAIAGSSALFFSSNTLVGAEERELTMRAREAALAAERPVIFDPNLRLHRWRSVVDAAASANACVPGALLVRANRHEATVMTGEDDPDRAARALVKGGARLVVVTLGRDGALLRGELRADVPGVPAQVVSTIGAGDVLTGTLLARLALSGFYPPALAASLPEAVAAGGEACERLAALD